METTEKEGRFLHPGKRRGYKVSLPGRKPEEVAPPCKVKVVGAKEELITSEDPNEALFVF